MTLAFTKDDVRKELCETHHITQYSLYEIPFKKFLSEICTRKNSALSKELVLFIFGFR